MDVFPLCEIGDLHGSGGAYFSKAYPTRILQKAVNGNEFYTSFANMPRTGIEPATVREHAIAITTKPTRTIIFRVAQDSVGDLIKIVGWLSFRMRSSPYQVNGFSRLRNQFTSRGPGKRLRRTASP